MATDKLTAVSDSPARVAFELMEKIANSCYESDKQAQKTREYWLKLYRQCYKASSGSDRETILRDD